MKNAKKTYRVDRETMQRWGIPARDAEGETLADCVHSIGEAVGERRRASDWWAWHEADYSRVFSTQEEADAACAAWVAGDSDTGPDTSLVTAPSSDGDTIFVYRSQADADADETGAKAIGSIDVVQS